MKINNYSNILNPKDDLILFFCFEYKGEKK